MKRLLFVFIILAAFSVSAQDEVIERQFKYASDLYNKEAYFDAVTEFKRLMFFDKENEYEYTSKLRIAESYKEGGFYDNAVLYYTKAALSADSVDDKFIAEEGIIRANILRKTTGRAHQLIDNALEKAEYYDKHNELLYWRGWAYMTAGEFELAEKTFARINDVELKNICSQAAKRKYSVTFARVISYILPGSGEIYTGEYLPGVISLGWNVLWGYLTVNALAEERVFDGLMTGGLLWLRFYNGSWQAAVKSAEYKNKQIYNDVMRYLQTNYEGIKP